jgi:hypothetical protein
VERELGGMRNQINEAFIRSRANPTVHIDHIDNMKGKGEE